MTKNDRLRAARIRQGLTQKEVAERVSVSVHTYRKWELSTGPQSFDVAVKLCKILEIDFYYYITGMPMTAVTEDELKLLAWFRKLSTQQQQGFIQYIAPSSDRTVDAKDKHARMKKT